MEEKIIFLSPVNKENKLLNFPDKLKTLTSEMYEDLYDKIYAIKSKCADSGLSLFQFENMLLNECGFYVVRVQEHTLKIKEYLVSPDGVHWANLREFKDGRKSPFIVSNLKKSGVLTYPKVDPENTKYIPSKNNDPMEALFSSVFTSYLEAEITSIFISSLDDGYSVAQTINFIQRYYRKNNPQIAQYIPGAIAAVNIILNKSYHVDVDSDDFKRGTLDRILNQLDTISKLIQDSRYQWTNEELDEVRQGIIETYSNLPEFEDD